MKFKKTTYINKKVINMESYKKKFYQEHPWELKFNKLYYCLFVMGMFLLLILGFLFYLICKK